jgi:hypothetical protein
MDKLIRKPDSKVSIGAGMGALSVVCVWGVQARYGITVPAEIGISASTFLTFAVQQWLS